LPDLPGSAGFSLPQTLLSLHIPAEQDRRSQAAKGPVLCLSEGGRARYRGEPNRGASPRLLQVHATSTAYPRARASGSPIVPETARTADGGMSDEWVERIADAVVSKIDEYEQVNAIARLVLRMLDQRQAAAATAPSGESTGPAQIQTRPRQRGDGGGKAKKARSRRGARRT